MKTYRNLLSVAVVAGMLAWLGGACLAQDAAAPADKDAATADKPSVKDDLASVLENMTPEQLADLIKKAVQARLSNERAQVVTEIQDGLLFEPDAKDAAIAALQDKPTNTQKENVERICTAFAAVDEPFGKAYKLYTDGKYTESGDAFKKMLNAKEASYFSAAKHYLYADSLAKAGLKLTEDKERNKLLNEAVDAYHELMMNMLDRISFTSMAAMNTADAFEKMGRGMYAMETYSFCIKNFALTLDNEQVKTIAARLEKLQSVYKEPMDSVARMMGDVKTRLDAIDSGKETQAKEKEVVALLEDLIKTTEENQKSGGKPPPGQNPGKKPGDDGKEPGDEGKTPGDPKTGKGEPKLTQRPTSPAQVSALPGGTAVRPTGLDSVRNNGETGDWAELPPREQEAIQEASKKIMSEHYKKIISAYFRHLADENATKAEENGK